MSTKTNDSVFPKGGFIKILRQRYFIDHSSDAKTFITEEYTLIGNRKDGVSNIILQFPNFLPNLVIYDSDGEELPIMPNSYTRLLIESWINEATGEQRERLIELFEQMQQQKTFLIWIKLPPNKVLKMNQVHIINLEYDAAKEKHEKEEIILDIFSPADHSVFYTIKKPDDYDFSEQIITVLDEKGNEKKLKNWKTKGREFLYVTETHDTLSITSKPTYNQPIKLHYSFKAQNHIIFFPISAAVLLSFFGVYLLMLQNCGPKCILYPLGEKSLLLLDYYVQIGIGIIAASLVLPRLITNSKIRHSMILVYFFPIGLAILLLIFESDWFS